MFCGFNYTTKFIHISYLQISFSLLDPFQLSSIYVGLSENTVRRVGIQDILKEKVFSFILDKI